MNFLTRMNNEMINVTCLEKIWIINILQYKTVERKLEIAQISRIFKSIKVLMELDYQPHVINLFNVF